MLLDHIFTFLLPNVGNHYPACMDVCVHMYVLID